jgi:hypothetical protein
MGTYVTFVEPAYNDVKLLVRYVIGRTYFELFNKCWVGEIECLLGTIIKKL